MLQADINSGICSITGRKKDILQEYAIIVNTLAHRMEVPHEIITLITAHAMADKEMIKVDKEFSSDDLGNLMNEIEKMKKEQEEKNEKENE